MTLECNTLHCFKGRQIKREQLLVSSHDW